MGVTSEKIAKCDHYLIEIDGTLVCCKCGKVENMFTFENDVTLMKNKKNKCNNFVYELRCKDVISEIVLNDAIFFINQWDVEKIPYKNIHEIYSVYYAAKLNNFPLTLKELSFFSGESIKNICKVEKYLKKNILSSPLDFLEKYCKLLNLTFFDEKLVKRKIEQIADKVNDSPSHITAAAISFTFPRIEIREITRATGVSSSSILKIAKAFSRGSSNPL